MHGKNKYNIVIADPAKNITIFVLDNIERKLYKDVAREILEKTDCGAEQVGFVKQPIMNGDIRLEMMGGEFCGNASRSIGMLFARENGIQKGNVLVEITGSDKALNAKVDLKEETSEIDMPIPKRIESIYVEGLGKFPIVIIEGINHIIVEQLDATQENFDKFKTAVYNNYDVEAFGVMFLDKENKYITPVVYVKNTDTTFFESSCGSGTLATVTYLGQDLKDGSKKYSISQPGGTIESEIIKENGQIKKITIGGVVKLSPKIKIEL
ncbi:MAG: hypothetical protein Q4E31_01295 [Intestinibacter bartlettii]|uniref:hypothetical protein n=1 Tax=Intestinibacter bartlettii TaxID=261299 RepID=UPI0026F31930|nr:hypothetical protein [Intestinibacter bartlettii]MDO5009433.1 hypothetical protein [Intestinibacter bartlettii]